MQPRWEIYGVIPKVWLKILYPHPTRLSRQLHEKNWSKFVKFSVTSELSLVVGEITPQAHLDYIRTGARKESEARVGWEWGVCMYLCMPRPGPLGNSRYVVYAENMIR